MGAYGIFRFSLEWFPQISQETSGFFSFIGVAGILYGAWLAWSQTDMKKLVAYSSVSHMGYIILGMFCNNQEGLSGAYMQMINHGISTGLLFLLVGIIYDKTHTRKIEDYKGLGQNFSSMCVLFYAGYLKFSGASWNEWLHRRIFSSHGGVFEEPMVGFFCHIGCDLWGSIYAAFIQRSFLG